MEPNPAEGWRELRDSQGSPQEAVQAIGSPWVQKGLEWVA